MKQISIFEALYERYKITKPIRLIELFGGIGSQAKALENLHANFEHYKLVEFDKYPVASYNAIHGTNFVPMDITKIHSTDLEIVDRDKYEYIMTYSFPCQDLSLVGKGRGMSKGSGTRSGLLWEVERLLTECTELPQVLLMENVPQVIGEKNIEDFRAWELFLENKGYSNYHQILNAKDYGIPQNRQRCFMISILGDAYYEFPEAIPLKLKLKDMIEKNVDSKYDFDFNKYQIKVASEYKSDTNKIKNGIYESDFEVFDVRFDEGCRIRKDKICPTIAARNINSISGIPIFLINKKTRFMTEKEAWRLMGFSDEDFERAAVVNTKNRLFKQAGNSIVVNVLMAIFSQLL